jgi:predicted DCC family thiol-disulfide oxidoreductase YuxK
VQARFPWIPARAYAESVQLIHRDGRTWQGAAAIEQLLTTLPRGWLISWIFEIPLVRVIAESVYRWLARNRYKLGCDEHCQHRPLDLDYHDTAD